MLTGLWEAIAAVITMNLTRPSIFGSEDTWVYLPVITLASTVIPSIYLLFLPNQRSERRRCSTYGSVDSGEGNLF